MVAVLAPVAAPSPAAQPAALFALDQIFTPEFARRGMVVAEESLAARAGLEILKAGGNAVDAAVATGFALAVTLPRAGNLGGGGFMLVHLPEQRRVVALDYREKAPSRAHRDIYIDPLSGALDEQAIRFSHRAAGVPGTVAGLLHVQERYGTLSRQQVMAPAIRLANHGFAVSELLASTLANYAGRLNRWPASRAAFLQEDGRAPAPGSILRQPDLGRTLELISEQGADAFYRGPIADLLVADMAAHDGLIDHQDLQSYRPVERQPVLGSYRDYRIVSMPPPSSGGVHLIQMLNILEGYPLAELGPGSAAGIHLLAESMKLAYADRSRHLGDPDFWPVPVEGLVSKEYASKLRQRIDPRRARPAGEIAPGSPPGYESPDTTHFVVVDEQGNVVSNTYTINFSYGSGIVVPGAGFLLNNEMDDFAAKPGTPNAFGLVGADANAVAAGKRPLSSMTPTLVFQDEQLVLATGSPGGSRIITTVLQVVINVLDHGMNLAAATAAPRVHHQWLPDRLFVEPGHSPDTLVLLRDMGHQVEISRNLGRAQSLGRQSSVWAGATDPRGVNGAAVAY